MANGIRQTTSGVVETNSGVVQTTTSGGGGPTVISYTFAGGQDNLSGSDLIVSSARAFVGEFSGHHEQDIDPVAKAQPSELPAQVSKFSWYFWEPSTASVGGLISAHDSSGTEMAGLGSSNPDWEYYGGNGWNRLFPHSEYKDWVKFEMNFDWSNSTVDFTATNTVTGTTETASGVPLATSASEVASFQIRPFSSPPSFTSGAAFQSYYDALTITI